jgi:hypothetical protein
MQRGYYGEAGLARWGRGASASFAEAGGGGRDALANGQHGAEGKQRATDA